MTQSREDKRLYAARYRREHPEKSKAAVIAAKARSPDRHHASNLRSRLRIRYGLTVEEFRLMVARHEGRCAICTETMVPPYIDHDHATGVVRGLLCQHCNSGIGLLKDRPDVLRSAILYLEKDRTLTVQDLV
jgi:hypothetical protein